MGRVSGKVALVTGAASGIGRATAILLAREGAKVMVADINEAGGADTVAAIAAGGGEARFRRLDVTSERDWDAAIAATVDAFGRLDVLVNNAGILIYGKTRDLTLDQWRKTMAINLDGVFLGTRAGILAMETGGGGSIVNISSVAGLRGAPGLSAYCASKGGVKLLTKAAAIECGMSGSNIRVNSIHPAPIDTPMVQEWVNATAEPDVTRRQLNRMPIGHMGEPNDIAFAVLYLASDESKFVTGAEMVVDGGAAAR